MTAGADDDLFGSGDMRPCGYGRWAGVLNASLCNLESAPTSGKKASTCKGKPARIWIQPETKDIRWTDDPDVDPTTVIGNLLQAGSTLEYSGALGNFRWTETSASAVVNITFFNN